MALLYVGSLLMVDRINCFRPLHEIINPRRLYILLIGIESFDRLGSWGLSLNRR